MRRQCLRHQRAVSFNLDYLVSCTIAGWFAAPPHKAWGERFFLLYSPFWISFFALIVASGAYERFAHVEYMVVCLAIAIPCALVPFLLRPKAEAALPFWSRFAIQSQSQSYF